MNKIEFVLSKYNKAGDDKYKKAGDKKYKKAGDKNKDYLVVEIKIDGNLLIDFQKYATDITSLISCSEYEYSSNREKYILNSWTGIHKDVGIYKPFKVRFEAGPITSEISDPKPISEFDKKELTAELDKLYLQLVAEFNKLGDELIEDVEIYKPIESKSESGRIIWEIGDPKPLKKKIFEFDKEEFAAALEKLYVQGDELIEELIMENQDRGTARDIEIVLDDNKRYFINPARYFDPLSALPYSKLPKELRKYREPYMNRVEFREIVEDSAEAIGGRVSDFGEPDEASNFFYARVDMRDSYFRDSYFYVLCSTETDWAFASDISYMQIRFIDRPDMANVMARMFGLTPLITAELSAPFQKRVWMSDSDIKSWKPQTMGEALFNFWD